jgi:polyhydroxybutyrate depolymerase
MNRTLTRTALSVATFSLIASGWAASAAETGGTTTTAASGKKCATSIGPGTTWVDVEFEGEAFPVRVHVPDGVAQDDPAPLVLNLHPSNGNAEFIAGYNDLDATADANGFITVAPNAVIPVADPNPDQFWLWNVPGVPTTAGSYPPPDARDDVAFLTRVIDTFIERGCADADRVYLAGFSGGARMASAYACANPDKVAAIAPVAGLRAGRPSPDAPHAIELQSCAPGEPVPVITFHGDADARNPYNGNTDKRWGYSVELAVQTWARFDGCTTGPEVTQVTEHVSKEAYAGCEGGSEVEFYKVAGGTHSWPGSPMDDSATQEVEASELIWDFFAQHKR